MADPFFLQTLSVHYKAHSEVCVQGVVVDQAYLRRNTLALDAGRITLNAKNTTTDTSAGEDFL